MPTLLSNQDLFILAHMTSTFVIPDANETDLVWSAVLKDGDGSFDGTFFTVPFDGRFNVHFHTRLANQTGFTAGDTMHSRFLVDGVDRIGNSNEIQATVAGTLPNSIHLIILYLQ